ncbi:hypothetical protein RhiXN_10249 [Rhizoctonia solani]|uniref:Uncharacterized protein n=1 Tax=Rhizoctonia solani TaxID=456999 RepID=A0A8H8P3S1_9AGAM|nr:uncharacterized protein RhiXN_10249 [Rhizoctonia solani]QRW23925.1 hypothetical protein RhiXN_10249 [Rhizoctonia solani]
MFLMPTPNNEEGTEQRPLLLPSDLCSLNVFETICEFIYPESVGIFPKITAKDIASWEPVLAAASALQMDGTIRYILQKLVEDSSQLLRSDAARFMRLIADHDTLPLSQLATNLVGPLCVFAFRRQPISPKEFSILGEKMSALAYHTRENVRDCFLVDQVKLIGSIQTDAACGQKESCRKAIFQQILGNMVNKSNDTSHTNNDQSDIFRITFEQGICSICCPQRSKLAHALMFNMVEGVVKKTYLEMVSTWEGRDLKLESESGLSGEQNRPPTFA